MFFRREETYKTIFTVEPEDPAFIDGINHDKTTSCLIVGKQEPLLDELQNFAADSFVCKVFIDRQTSYKHAGIPTHMFMCQMLHIVMPTTWQIIGSDTVI